DGTCTNGAAAPIAVWTTSRSGRSSSATSRQNVSAASRYWAVLISSSSRSSDSIPFTMRSPSLVLSLESSVKPVSPGHTRHLELFPLAPAHGDLGGPPAVGSRSITECLRDPARRVGGRLDPGGPRLGR